MPSSTWSSAIRSLLRSLAGRLPFSLDVQGPRRDRCLALADLLAGRGDGLVEIALPEGPLSLDLDHANQRLMASFAANLRRGQRLSPLGLRLSRLAPRAEELFVDVGANLGLCSLHARSRGFSTLLFEPEPRHAAYLERNGALFGRVERIALAERDGSATFHVGAETNPGASSLVGGDAGGETYASSIEVRLRRFDGWIAESDVAPGRIAFVKIDVEGAEAETVAGFAAFLEAGHRPEFWCEVRGPSSTRAPDSWKAVRDHLVPFGYRAFLWEGEVGRPFPGDGPVPAGVFDLLFLPEDRPL